MNLIYNWSPVFLPLLWPDVVLTLPGLALVIFFPIPRPNVATLLA